MMRSRYEKGNIMYHMNLTPRTFKQQVVTLYLTVSVGLSKKWTIAITLVSWPRLHFLSNVIPQTLNNEALTETVSLQILYVRTVSEKNEKKYM